MLANISQLESLQSTHGHSTPVSSMTIFNAPSANAPQLMSEMIAQGRTAWKAVKAAVKAVREATDQYDALKDRWVDNMNINEYDDFPDIIFLNDEEAAEFTKQYKETIFTLENIRKDFQKMKEWSHGVLN